MKLSTLFLGLFFLFNPNISIFDFLPDAIGYLLIFYALSEPSLIRSELAEARDAFRSLLIVCSIKIGANLLLVFMQSGGRASFDRGWNMTLAFAFALIELWFAFKAFSRLFDGMDALLMRHGTPTDDDKHSNAVTMTAVFFIAKHALCVAAELPFLLETKTTGTITAFDTLSPQSIRTVLTVLNLNLVCLLGIVWLILMRSYLSAFRKDDFTHNLAQAYHAYFTEHPYLRPRKRLLTALRLIECGGYCMISFAVWNINLIPDALFGVLVLIALALFHAKNAENERLLTLPRSVFIRGIAFSIAAGAQYAISIIFFAIYHTADETQAFSDIILTVIGRDRTALALLIALFIFTVAEAVTLVLFVWGLRTVLRRTAEKYTAVQTQNAQLRTRNSDVIAELTQRLNAAFAGSCVLGISMIAQQCLLFSFGFLWFITFLCSIAFAILNARAAQGLSQAAKTAFYSE